MKALTTVLAALALSLSLFVAHEVIDSSAPASVEVAKKKKKNNRNQRNRPRVKKHTIESKGLTPENKLGSPGAAKKMAELVDKGRQSISGVSGQSEGARAAAAALEAMKKKKSGLK